MNRGVASAPPAGTRRRAGARARRQHRAAAAPLAVAGVRRRIPTYRLLDEEGLDLIDRTTDRILQCRVETYLALSILIWHRSDRK